VTRDGGLLQVRNRIYATVFDDVWVNLSLERRGAASEPKERFIDVVKGLFRSPDRPKFDYDVFVSYSTRDRVFVEYLIQNLKLGGLKTFVDTEDIRLGASLMTAIESALTRSRNIMVVLSPAYMASAFAARELDLAVRLRVEQPEVRLIPLLLRDTDIPPFLSTVHHVDFRKRSAWNQSMEVLLEALSPKSRIQLADPSPAPAERYNSAVIRELLETAFDEEDLAALAYDYFRSIYPQLRSGKPKKAMIQEIIEYFDQDGNYDQLLDAIAQTRPREYRSFAPRLERPAAQAEN
jgi:hypothetical protein